MTSKNSKKGQHLQSGGDDDLSCSTQFLDTMTSCCCCNADLEEEVEVEEEATKMSDDDYDDCCYCCSSSFEQTWELELSDCYYYFDGDVDQQQKVEQWKKKFVVAQS